MIYPRITANAALTLRERHTLIRIAEFDGKWFKLDLHKHRTRLLGRELVASANQIRHLKNETSRLADATSLQSAICVLCVLCRSNFRIFDDNFIPTPTLCKASAKMKHRGWFIIRFDLRESAWYFLFHTTHLEIFEANNVKRHDSFPELLLANYYWLVVNDIC